MADTGEIQGEIIIDPAVEQVVKDLVEDVTMFVEIHIEDDTTLEPPETKKSKIDIRKPQLFGVSVKGYQNNNGKKIPFHAFPTGQGLFVPLLGHPVPYGAEEGSNGKVWEQLCQKNFDAAIARKQERAMMAQKAQEKELRSEEECEAGPSGL